MKNVVGYVSIVFLMVALVGCATKAGLVASFEDLSTESQKEGWIKAPQERVISVSGLVPFSNVGGLYFYKAKRKPSAAIGFSNYSSFVLETKVMSKCGLECLTSIRDSITKLQNASADLIEEHMEISRMKYQAASEGAKMTSSFQGYSTAEQNALKTYKSNRKNFNELQASVSNKIKDSGVVVFRWATATDNQGKAEAGDILKTSFEKSQNLGGYALISGLRTATLFVGPDILKGWPKLNKQSRYSNRFELTTYVMQAENIVYFTESDMARVIGAKLEASYKELSNIPETIKNLDRIEVEAILSKASSFSNMGIISDPERHNIPIHWTDNGLHEQLCIKGYSTIYSVETDVNDLIDMVTPQQK